MKTTVLVAALLAAYSMPAFADDAVKTDNAANMSYVDPVTTRDTTTADQSDMQKATVRKSGCMRRQALNMM